MQAKLVHLEEKWGFRQFSPYFLKELFLKGSKYVVCFMCLNVSFISVLGLVEYIGICFVNCFWPMFSKEKMRLVD